METRGWSRRSRRDTPAVSDAAFVSMQRLASALRQRGNSRRATRCYGAKTQTRTARPAQPLYKVAEQAGAEVVSWATPCVGGWGLQKRTWTNEREPGRTIDSYPLSLQQKSTFKQAGGSG
jgi:hypothetical protein